MIYTLPSAIAEAECRWDYITSNDQVSTTLVGLLNRGITMTRRIRVPSPLSELMASCMTCVFGCCRLDAFNTSPELIQKWQQKDGENDLQECLKQLDRFILSAKEDVEFSVGMQIEEFREGKGYKLREVFYSVGKEEWIDFLLRWEKGIQKVLTT